MTYCMIRFQFAGMNKAELARSAEISRQMLYDIMDNKKQPTLDVAFRIVDAINQIEKPKKEYTIDDIWKRM